MKLKFIRDSHITSSNWWPIGFTKGSDQYQKLPLEARYASSGKRTSVGTRPNITAIKDKSMSRYGEFFSRDRSYAVYDGSRKGSHYPVVENAYAPLYNWERKFSLRKFDPKTDAIRGSNFGSHLKYVKKEISKQAWLFIQAAGSHAHRMFEDNLENKRFFGTRWKPMAESTARKRRKLAKMKKDPIAFYGKHKSLLDATGRLKNSIKIDSIAKVGSYKPTFTDYNTNEVAVAIWTDHSLFQYDYPHRKSGKNNTEYAFYHNEGYGTTPRRQFIGPHPKLFKDMQELMDAHLFYAIFNRLGGVRSRGGWE